MGGSGHDDNSDISTLANASTGFDIYNSLAHGPFPSLS